MLPFRAGKFFRDFPDFLHRKAGVRELPQAGSPLTGGSFSAPTQRGTRTAAGVFAPNGRLLFCTDPAGHSNCRRRVRPFRAESFSLNLSRGIRRLRTAGASRRPPRGAKRKGHLRFPFLFELLPFPCLLARRRLPTCDRSEMEYGRGFFLPYLSQPVRSVRYITATQTRKPPLGAA